jgi:hypothetical protein
MLSLFALLEVLWNSSKIIRIYRRKCVPLGERFGLAVWITWKHDMVITTKNRFDHLVFRSLHGIVIFYFTVPVMKSDQCSITSSNIFNMIDKCVFFTLCWLYSDVAAALRKTFWCDWSRKRSDSQPTMLMS